MATSSRRFQSQTMARLVAGYHQVAHGARRWLRQGRTAAVWGLQVAIYPLYAAVQGLRLGYRRLRASPGWQRAWARLKGQDLPLLVTADTPIRALLSVLQPPVLSATVGRPPGLSFVSRYGRWLKQSRAGAVLTPGHWHLLSLRAPVRGIASDRSTRRLVLVMADNAVFDGLNQEQQQRLERAILLMLTEYARGCRHDALDQTLRHPWLPLPQAKPRLLPLLRWVPKTLGWMQASPLAAATNLFGEASQQWAIQAMTIPHRDSSRHHSRAHPRTGMPQAIASVQPRYADPQSLPQYRCETLSATTSVADAVALVLAGPSALGGVERSPATPGLPGAGAALAVRDEPGAVAGGTGGPRLTTGRTLPIDPAAGTNSSPGSLPAKNRPPLFAPRDLEATVTHVDYIDPPLVAVLRGLDWVLYALETWLRRLGAWLRQHW